MIKEKVHQVIILGAGPAGLCLAKRLQDNGLSPLLIEAGDSPGQSWREMPDFLSLVSLWKSNYLIKKDRFKFSPIKQVHSNDFVGYLRSFAKRFEFNIQLNSKVQKVSKEQSLFKIETDCGAFYSEVLVNATGYYQNPFTPNYAGLEKSTILNLHFKDYKNPTSLNGKKNILIVGARLSAGQILPDLKDAGVKLSLSTRSQLVSMSPPPFFQLGLMVGEYFETLSNEKKSTSAPMFYEAKKMIDNKQVEIYPDIKSIQSESVSFVNGQTEPFDAIIFATGFKPELKHLSSCLDFDEEAMPKLSNSFEALYCENLFLLGLDHQRNLQSRFLRGIRNDAIQLSTHIKKRLNT